MKIRLLCCCIFLFFLNATSQESAEDHLGTWFILSTSNKVSEKLNFNLQSQIRTYELISEIQQFKIRAGLQYKFSDKISGTVGYAYFRNDPSYLLDLPKNFTEHRIVEDLNIKNSFGKLNLMHRYRLEHRFFVMEEGTTTTHWIRYMAKLSYPLNEKWGLDVYDEVFLNFEDPIFAQNWLGGGLSYSINKLLKLRAGYFKIMQTGQNFDRLQLGLSIATDLRKKQKED